MSVTINAHQLGRLIDQTAPHVADEYTEPLNGIRLDIDDTHLYAVATDRYTLAAARYRLGADKGGEAFARTIPAAYLAPLRAWVNSQKGHIYVEISTGVGRLVFTGPHTELRIPVTDSLEFPDWRGLFRTIAGQTTVEAPFPALDVQLLARFGKPRDILRVRVSQDRQAVLFVGEDFLGAQMPVRYSGIGPCKDETFDQARALWSDILGGDGEPVDMATGMPAEEPNGQYEVTKDIRETGENLLKQVMRSTRDMCGKAGTNDDEFLAHVMAGIHAWMAYRYLDALHTADPRLAAQVIADTAEELDSGELGEFAWDAAESAGFNPQKWANDYEAFLKKRDAGRASAGSDTPEPASAGADR
ncbi:hypothetical protein AB0M57_04340 [Streptomyces sp. NPDC051597]|uniref:DNA polymerase III subunit beta family protein n=1 Tax=Streptomyces sp. NPDC051597 TaxID=3155049 RepID=UPI0034159451